MILKNENSIYMFYEVVEQLEPQTILDVGMFLKRVGAVSRKVMSREITEDKQMYGIDFYQRLHSLYGVIFITGLRQRSYIIEIQIPDNMTLPLY